VSSSIVIVYYVSSHGFGHAVRVAQLVNALAAREPDLRVELRTGAPRWLFQGVESRRVVIEACETDPALAEPAGVIDEPETARRASAFYQDFDRRVADETARLRAVGPALVVGDVPPLAFAAARQAGVPSAAVANFTWDWIYAFYPGFERLAPGVLATIANAYSGATAALRLPCCGGFDAMSQVVEDVPFIACRSTRDPVETRRLLDVGRDRPLVLWSFGGSAVMPEHDTFARSQLNVIAPQQTLPAGLRHGDLVAAADVVVSKPGYGIVSECVANRRPLLYTSRGHFAEYETMVAEMPRMLRCRFVPREDLMSGRWTDAVAAVLAQPEPPEPPRVDGAEWAADRLLSLSRR